MAEFLASNVEVTERINCNELSGLKSEIVTVKVEFFSSGNTSKFSNDAIEFEVLDRLRSIAPKSEP